MNKEINVLYDTVDMNEMKVQVAVDYDLHEDEEGVYIIFNNEKVYLLVKDED